MEAAALKMGSGMLPVLEDESSLDRIGSGLVWKIWAPKLGVRGDGVLVMGNCLG